MNPIDRIEGWLVTVIILAMLVTAGLVIRQRFKPKEGKEYRMYGISAQKIQSHREALKAKGYIPVRYPDETEVER